MIKKGLNRLSIFAFLAIIIISIAQVEPEVVDTET
jgi:hypothetical protein